MAAGAATVAGSASASIDLFDNGGSGWTVTEGSSLYFDIDGNVTTGKDGVGFQVQDLSTMRMINNAPGDGVFAFADSRLDFGDTISGVLTDSRGFFSYSGGATGGWSIPDSGYMGFQFNDGTGIINYGWAELTLNDFGSEDTFVLNRYAVETTPGLGITAGAIPEPSTLVFLLAGATGLYYIRNRKKNKAV